MPIPFMDDAFVDKWQGTPESGGGNVPDGKHVAILKEQEITENEYGSTIVFSWYFPEFNRTEKDFNNVSEKSIPILKGKLKKLGVNVDSPSTIPAQLSRLVGTKATIEKKTSGKYRNYYINSAEALPF